MRRPVTGTGLLILLVLSWYLYLFGRTLHHNDGPPAFFFEETQGIHVYLGEGFPVSEVRQFGDAVDPCSVISMTLEGGFCPPALAQREGLLLRDGEALSLKLVNDQVLEITRYWMPAVYRMALGIPLHPDRMTRDDWESLPGIGPRLAERIEADRQQNGDFGTLEALDRVRGIGPSKIEGLKKYF